MKKLIIAVLWALLLMGCVQRQETEDKRVTVCTSFYAIYDFTKAVGGDKINIVNMVPTGTEPHDWEPSSHDMLKLSDAGILFYNGMGMEGWIDKVESSLGENKVEFVELAEGIGDESKSDPHVWLNPKNVMDMTDKISDKLIQADPDNEEYYKKNAQDFKNQLNELDLAYRQALEPYAGRSIVVSHEAYSYLCDEYGIVQKAVEGVIPESEPSPEQMKNIIDYINENNIRYIFFEELLSPKVVQTIADETGAQLLELNPFEGLSQEDIDNGEDYISVMYDNLDNLKLALE